MTAVLELEAGTTVETEENETVEVTTEQITTEAVADRQLPWMGLATGAAKDDESIDLETLLKRAGLDWGTEARPMWRRLNSGEYVQDEKLREIYRTDNEDRLGVVRTKYENITNHEAFAFGDNLVQQGVATWAEAGLQHNGSYVFASMKLGEGFSILDEDAYELYLFLRMGHGVGMSVLADVVPFRAFCLNQSNLAMETTVSSWSIAHTRSVKTRLAEAHAAMQHVAEYSTTLGDTLEKLALTKINVDEVKKLYDKAVPKKRAKRVQVLDGLLATYENSQTVAPYLGTAYGALNAATEFYDHVIRRDNANSRFNAAMTGEGMMVRNALSKRLMALAA